MDVLKWFKNWKVLVGILVILIFANLLIVKYVVSLPATESQSIAVLKTYKAVGNCFYQKKFSPKWLFLSGEEILNSSSQIQTDADSHVVMSFVDANGRLEVSEKTHIGIYKNAQETTIDFKKGELFVNYQTESPKDHLVVQVGKKSFQLSNSDLYIFGEADGQVAVSVDYGKATMTVGDRTNTFEKGQMAYFKNDREYTVEESPFKVQTPLNYDHYSLDDDTYKVRFAFAAFPKDYNVQMLLGKTLYDMKPYFPKEQIFKNNEFFVTMPQGSYYWRLIAYDKPKGAPLFYSHIKRFFIEPKIRIQPVMPLANSKFLLQSENSQVRFQWDNPSQLEKTFIEISDQKTFSHVLVHESTSNSNYFIYKFANAGDYYWRVSGFPFGSSDLINGAYRKISVIRDEGKQMVKLLFPKDNITLTTLSLKNADITFQWSKNSPTKTYNIEIESLTQKSKYEYQSDTNALKVTDLAEGNYTWRVVDKDNAQVHSKPENFKVVKTDRLDFKTLARVESSLNWDKGPKGTSSYRVEVLKIGSKSNLNEFFYKTSTLRKSYDIKSEQLNYKSFPEGVYAFKVYALDKQKNVIADSEMKFLKVPGRP